MTTAPLQLAYLVCLDPDAPQTRVAGMPLWLRTVCGLQDLGVDQVVVVLPSTAAGWAPAADPRLTATVSVVTVEDLPPAGGPALVLRGDQVFRRELVRAVVEGAAEAAGSVGTVRPAPGDPPHLSGVAVVDAKDVAPVVTEAMGEGLEAALTRRQETLRPVEVAGGFALPAGDRAQVRVAEKALLEALRKPIDGFMAKHLNRHVSLFITGRLMHTGLTANQVSVFNLLLGITAAAVCAQGGYLAGALGGLLLELQSILDGVDGELARLKFLRSRTGEWLDTISDDLGTILFIGGMAFNVAHDGRGWALWVGAAGMGAMILAQGLTYWLLITIYRSGDLLAIQWDSDPRVTETHGWLDRLRAAVYFVMKRDSFVTLFCVLALLGRLDVGLIVASAGAVGFLPRFFAQMSSILRDHRAGTLRR